MQSLRDFTKPALLDDSDAASIGLDEALFRLPQLGIAVWVVLLQGIAGPVAWAAASAVVVPALAFGGARTFALGLVVAGLVATVAQATAQLWLTAAIWPDMWVMTAIHLAVHCAVGLAAIRAMLGLAACSAYELEEMRLAAAEQRLPQPDAASGEPNNRAFWPIAV